MDYVNESRKLETFKRMSDTSTVLWKVSSSKQSHGSGRGHRCLKTLHLQEGDESRGPDGTETVSAGRWQAHLLLETS